MTFFVEKKLALGPIRFGVSPRQLVENIEQNDSLSTGATGEFVPRGAQGFFFEDRTTIDQPILPTTRSITATPFVSSLKPDGTPRSYGFLALLGFGAILFLLGLAVVGRKGPQGWVEVILGAAMIATPIILTAQRRKQIREQEERERAEREATERRNRELLAAYTSALARAREQRDESAFAQLARESAALTLPYEIWGPTARRSVLYIGFQELARRGVNGAADVARSMDRASAAAGLSPVDAAGAKRDLYETVQWHLLADDRLGPSQERQLRALQKALGGADSKAVEQFRRLRGMTTATLPRQQCSMKLDYKEQCIHQTQAVSGLTHVTNRRIVVERKKRTVHPFPSINDVTVEADDSVVRIRTENPKKPLRLRVDDPIYTAGVIDLASSIDERPKGFA
jgi:hypothetical protein